MRKNNFIQTTLSLVLSVAVITSLTACSSSSPEPSNSDSTTTGSPSSSASGSADNTISVILPKSTVCASNEDIPWVQQIEKEFKEATGYSIEWIEIADSTWGERKQNMFATGDIPDLILNDGSSPADLMKYSLLFEDLSDDIDSMPNVKKMFEEHPTTRYLAETEDGAIYGLTRYSRFWPRTATRQYINKEWLDNLGLEMPTTWDELHDVLIAFRDQDANGNGDPTDEIPMDFSPIGTGGFGYFQPSMLIASNGITLSEGGNKGFYSDHGTIKNFFIEDSYKETVKFLNQLWNEGLISQKAFTQDYSSYQSVARGGGDENTSLVGFSWGWVSLDRFGAILENQYVPLAPLKISADGPDPSWSYDCGLNYGTGTAMVSAKTEHKDACLWLINQMYSEEYSLQQIFGSFGVGLEKTSDTSYTVLPPDDPTIDQGTWQMMNSWGGCINIPDNIEVALGPDLQQSSEQTISFDPYLDQAEADNNVLPLNFLKYSEADATTMANNNTNMMNIAMTSFSNWVTNGGIDEEWDAYVTSMTNSGLQENMTLMQASLDKYNAMIHKQ